MWWIAGALALAAAGTPRIAHAQDESADVHVQRGVEAAQAGQWEEARVAFERAYVLEPRPPILLNLAGAESRTGRLVAAANHYRLFLELATERRYADARRAARATLEQIETRIAHLLLRIEDRRRTDRVEVNGRPWSGSDDVPVDPGAYDVRLVRGERTIARASGSVAEGETLEVVLTAVSGTGPLEEPDPDPVDPDPGFRLDDPPPVGRDDGEDGFWSSPWPWVGAGALVVIGIVVIIAASGGSDPRAETCGTIGPCRVPVM